MSRTVLMVGAGVMAEGYLHAAQRLGLRVGLVESRARLAALAGRFGCVSEVAEVDDGCAGLDEAWLAPAMALAGRLSPQAVWGFAEPHVFATAMAQHRLGLPGPGLDAAAVARNKALQRAEFARAGLPQPAHRFVARLSDATGWATPRLPVVVKPLALQGSAGVERVTDPGGWAGAVARRDGEGALLVEAYVDGPEYSYEALVQDGKVLFGNLTGKQTSGPPYFVELLHEVGPEVGGAALRAAADRLGAAVVRALGMATGIMHLEFRRRGGPDDLVIMEVAVRTPGDHILELIARSHRFDVYAACLGLALGDGPVLPEPATARRACGSLFVTTERAGTLVDPGLAGWAGLPGVARYDARLAVGQPVRPAENSTDRLAYAVLDCADRAELERLVADLRARWAPVVDRQDPAG